MKPALALIILNEKPMRAKFQRKDKSMSDVKWIKFDKTFFDDELRYDINNGMTLCHTCHFKKHNGNWRN